MATAYMTYVGFLLPSQCQLHAGEGRDEGLCHQPLAWNRAKASLRAVQTLITQTLSQANPTAITAEEYFNPNFELGNRDMGRPMELTTKTQK